MDENSRMAFRSARTWNEEHEEEVAASAAKCTSIWPIESMRKCVRVVRDVTAAYTRSHTCSHWFSLLFSCNGRFQTFQCDEKEDVENVAEEEEGGGEEKKPNSGQFQRMNVESCMTCKWIRRRARSQEHQRAPKAATTSEARNAIGISISQKIESQFIFFLSVALFGYAMLTWNKHIS